MNTNDYQPMEGLTMAEALRLQGRLMLKMEPGMPLIRAHGLDTREGQDAFRTTAWRICEELCELEEAWRKWRRAPLQAQDEVWRHVLEEATDAFNFYMELCLSLGGRALEDPLPGFTSERPSGGMPDAAPGYAHMAIYHLGMAANRLKSRAWRRTEYLVDMAPFETEVMLAGESLRDVFAALGETSLEGVLRLWSLKYQVNIFRLETNY